LAVSRASSLKPNVVEFYVNKGAWETYRRVNQAACWFVPWGFTHTHYIQQRQW